MPDLTQSRPKQNGTGAEEHPAAGERPSLKGIIGILPVPRTLGSFVILITILAFIAGEARNELALTLLGTVFLTILAYCFFSVLFLGLLHRRKARSLSLFILSENVNTGKEGELVIKSSGGDPPKKSYFWRLPAVLIRCELCLETKDGRVIRHYADPGTENYSKFPVKERGAYYGKCERLVIFDAPLFFRLSLPVGNSVSSKPRLLALPRPAEEAAALSLKSGGAEQRSEPHYRKSDELTDHRPYVPGDDPRRINWKLYSHAPLGDLFVREGESVPPPHSRLLIMIDTEADATLYSVNEGRRAVDLLCENALAAALEFSARGMDILIGYSGQSAESGSGTGSPLNAAELASRLAWPAAIFRPNAAIRAVLPRAPEDRSVLILALPRSSTESSALDLFIKNRETRQSADLVFLYDAESQKAVELEGAARACVNLYNRRPGVHAEKIAVAAQGREN